MFEHQSTTQERGLTRWLAFFLHGTSAISLFILMLVTCIDVVGRYFFNNPLTGSVELTEIFVCLMVMSALPIICWRDEHVIVDILDAYASNFVHFVRSILFNVIMAIALFFVGKRILTLAARSLSYGEQSEYLGFPTGYLTGFVGIMCCFSALQLLTVGISRSYKAYKKLTPPE